jgi:hypothetical protein
MMGGIPIGSVSAMCVLQSPREGVRLAWSHDEMDMVGHQTVANERQAVQLNALAQKIKVNPAICITIKDEPSRVPSLGHVMRHPDGHDSRQSRHERHLALEMNLFAAHIGYATSGSQATPVHHARQLINFS